MIRRSARGAAEDGLWMAWFVLAFGAPAAGAWDGLSIADWGNTGCTWRGFTVRGFKDAAKQASQGDRLP